jgi:HEAT repeat protein
VVPGDPPTERAARRGGPTGAAVNRRAAAIAGHRADETQARDALCSADETVAASGLAALVRMGTVTVADLTGALESGASTLRRRAAELAAAVARGDPQLDAALLRALGDPEPLVAEAACFALGERFGAMGLPGSDEAVERLSRLSRCHPEAHVREAAVAALGAIGDPGGLPAVLAALTDRPTVRRRAAVALAAFDDEEAEAALQRCLNDRDWQVRSVAETLLDRPPS